MCAGVFVLVACRDVTLLDAALTRAGRLHHCVRLHPPSVSDLRAMLEYHLPHLPLHEHVTVSAGKQWLLPGEERGGDDAGSGSDVWGDEGGEPHEATLQRGTQSQSRPRGGAVVVCSVIVTVYYMLCVCLLCLLCLMYLLCLCNCVTVCVCVV